MPHELNINYLVDIFLSLSWFAALFTVPSVLLQRAGQPTVALSWLLALFALPSIAVIVWWLIGRNHLRKKSHHLHHTAQNIMLSLQSTHDHFIKINPQLQALQLTHSCLAPALPAHDCDSVFPASSGNKVVFLKNTEQSHQAWLQLITDAKHHLHLLFYIWRDDAIGRKLRDTLAEKAASGVEVRILYDAVGSLSLANDFFKPLIQQGGEVAKFIPINLFSASPTINFRNHRKLIIADAQLAYTGGINVGDEYLNWQDIGITIEGLGVHQLQEVFINDWYFTTKIKLNHTDYFKPAPNLPKQSNALCETISSNPHQQFNTTRDMTLMAINQCQQRLWISTPYFIPGPALMLALRSAVYRGVDVRLFLPHKNDSWLVGQASQVFYEELIQSGVRIFASHSMLHAKAILIDGDSLIIGSANLDVRSFKLNFEVSTFIKHQETNQALTEFFNTIHLQSTEVKSEHFSRISLFKKLQNSTVHLLSPLL